MNSHLEDLQSDALNKLPEYFPERSNIDEEEIISRAAVEITSNSAWLVSYFHSERYGKQKFNVEDAKRALHNTLRWVTLVMYIMDLDAPDNEDIEDFADTYPIEIRVDGMLAALSMQSSACDLVEEFYLEGTTEKDTYLDYLGEITSCVVIIAERLKSNITEILSFK